MPQRPCENCRLRQQECFKEIAAEELEFLGGFFRYQRELEADEYLFTDCARSEALGVLYEGWAVGLYKVHPDGPPFATEILLPGDLLDPHDGVGINRCISIKALTAVRYCVLDRSVIEAVARRGGSLCFDLTSFMLVDRVRRENRAILQRTGTPQQRLASFLFEIYWRLKIMGAVAEKTIPFPVAPNLIAEIVGLPEDDFEQALAEMRKSDVIEFDGENLHIRDEQELGAIARHKPDLTPQWRLLI